VSRLGPLAEREFRLLFAGRTISFLGNAVAPVAVAFAVLDLTGSATDLGFVLGAWMLPRIVFTLVGGVWGDRARRSRLMVTTNVASTAIQTLTAVLLLTHTARLWHLVVLQAAAGTSASLMAPAARGIVTEAVSEPLLQSANALLRIGINATQVLGGALGGVMVAAAGPGWAFAFDAATYAVSAALLARMHVGTARVEPSRFVDDLREGWRAFASRRWILVTVAAFSLIVFAELGAWQVLGPATAKARLGGASAWGAILAAQAAGLIGGGVLSLRWRPRRPLLVGQSLCVLVVAPLALLAAPAPVAVIAVAAAAAGAGLELFEVWWETALQRHVPPGQLSRVASYDQLGSLFFLPLGYVVAGPAAAAIGRADALYAAAALAGVATLAPLLSRDVRTLTL
jgi:MFS family permease